MTEAFYRLDSGWIAGFLLALMGVTLEVGYRLGKPRDHEKAKIMKDHVNAIQSGILGILALLLGFTFSLSLQRFDSRSSAVLAEANSIEMAALRADLLPAEWVEKARQTLLEYVDLRVEDGRVRLVPGSEHQRLTAAATEKQRVLWEIARSAMKSQPTSNLYAQFSQSIGDLMDGFARNNAGLQRHVPEVVLGLLFLTFLMAGLSVGFASGFAGHRPSFLSFILVGLIGILVFIILDLDRPRRGFIRVNQRSMEALQSSLRESMSVSKPSGHSPAPNSTP